MAFRRDLKAMLQPTLGIAPVTLASASTEQLTGIVDMQGVEQVLFLIVTGTITDTDATYVVTVYHGNVVNSVASPTTITDSSAAPDDALVGTELLAGFTFAADGGVRSIAYYPGKGTGKRYCRMGITPTGDTGSLPFAVVNLIAPLNQPFA